MEHPKIYVIAGPNGIGKTTSDFDFIPRSIPIINSDEIAAEAKRAGLITGNTQEYANGEAVRLMNEYLNNGASFGFETNLSDLDTWKFLLKIQETGYQLHIIYVSTGNLEALNARINNRVKEGGHYVRPDIVEERYFSGLRLLNHYFNKPDRLQLFDNSESMLLEVELVKGKAISAVVRESLPK
jgi:predicted ABC-type ATPase